MLFGEPMSRVLVIDDDKFVRMSIRAVLEGAGHDVSEAGDADTGIALQRAEPFDALIVDLIMPEKEGLEAIRELKQDYPDLPILAISGGGEIVKKNFVQVAHLFGAAATLEKPFGGEDLLDMLNAVMIAASHPSKDNSINKANV